MFKIVEVRENLRIGSSLWNFRMVVWFLFLGLQAGSTLHVFGTYLCLLSSPQEFRNSVWWAKPQQRLQRMWYN